MKLTRLLISIVTIAAVFFFLGCDDSLPGDSSQDNTGDGTGSSSQTDGGGNPAAEQKKLHKITHYNSDSSIDYTTGYTYDAQGRLSRTTCTMHGIETEFRYSVYISNEYLSNGNYWKRHYKISDNSLLSKSLIEMTDGKIAKDTLYYRQSESPGLITTNSYDAEGRIIKTDLNYILTPECSSYYVYEYKTDDNYLFSHYKTSNDSLIFKYDVELKYGQMSKTTCYDAAGSVVTTIENSFDGSGKILREESTYITSPELNYYGIYEHLANGDYWIRYYKTSDGSLKSSTLTEYCQ